MRELAGISNPFRFTVVPDPWTPNLGDVAEIHDDAFRRCRDALEAVRREGRTRSIVVYGEAGSGKTHLLRRLRAHWLGEPPHALDPIRPETVFVAARLQTGPGHLWRYLRHSLVEDLLRIAPDGTTQVERLILLRFAEVRPADADLRLWYEWLQSVHPDPADLRATLDDLFERVDAESRLGRDLGIVLGHLLRGRLRRDAKAWLRGDPLPASALDALGLAAHDDDADPEDRAREAVGALCRLAGPKIPVVLAFDQIEALQVDRDDTAALSAFGRVVMELFHQTDNVLLLSCVQIAFLGTLQQAMIQPAWDRLAMERHAIRPLLWPEATRLIASRLDATPGLKGLQDRHPDRALWPLDEAKLKERVGGGETARRILADCAEAFDALVPEGDSKDREPSPESFLEAEWGRRERDSRARRGPEGTGEILEHGLPLLVRATAPGWELARDHGLRDIDLLWKGPDGRVGVHLSHARDQRSVWRPLERLPDLLRQKRLEKLVVVRDARLPITGAKTKRLYNELMSRGAVGLRPTVEALAALDALRGMLSDARAGDLDWHGEPIGPGAVEAWLAGRMPTTLRALADDLLAYPGVEGGERPDPTLDGLTAVLDRTPVLSLAEAAEELGLPADRLVEAVRRRPEAAGLLDGPPPTLFRLVPDADHPD